MGNILGYDNTHNNFIMNVFSTHKNLIINVSRILFPMTSLLQIITYLSLMHYMINTQLLLVIVFIFPLLPLMIHSKSLLLTSPYPLFIPSSYFPSAYICLLNTILKRMFHTKLITNGGSILCFLGWNPPKIFSLECKFSTKNMYL